MSLKEVVQHVIPGRHMQFAPVQEDDDELSESIKNDSTVQDDHWNLAETIDPEKLDAFWSDAVQELGGLPPEDQEPEN